jgi:hypothetical protein
MILFVIFGFGLVLSTGSVKEKGINPRDLELAQGEVTMGEYTVASAPTVSIHDQFFA